MSSYSYEIHAHEIVDGKWVAHDVTTASPVTAKLLLEALGKVDGLHLPDNVLVVEKASKIEVVPIAVIITSAA